MKRFFIIWFIVHGSIFAQANTDSLGVGRVVVRLDSPQVNPTTVDEFIEDQAQSLSGQQFLEEMNDRVEHPIDLNSATKEDLLSIPGMNPVTAGLIVNRRRETGTMQTMSHMNDIDGLDPQLLSYVRMFTAPQSVKSAPTVSVRSRCFYDFQKSRGYKDGSYEGSRPALQNRVRWKASDHIEASFLTEKDAGEKSFTDFTSGYLCLSKVGIVPSAVLGDFVVESGNGTAFGYASSLGKGSDVILPVSRTARGVIPYRSSGEAHFFRGGGVNVRINSFEGFFFLSRRKVDATLNDSGTVLSLYDLGYHRTENEKAKRAVAREDIMGARLGWTVFQNVSIGSLWYSARIDPALNPADPFRASGNNFTSVSLDYHAAYSFGKKREILYFSGEWMRDHNGMLGGATELILRLPTLQGAVGYRLYPDRFISLFGSGFGEHGETMQNEQGLYIGFRTDIAPDMQLSTYWDFYEFPWRTMQNPLPTTGRDVLVELEMNLSKILRARIRYRVDSREEVEEQQRQTIRVEGDITPWSGIEFHSRIEMKWVKCGSSENGVMLYQNVRANIIPRFSIEGRAAYYETDSFDSAVYEYESDVSGTFTSPGLYGRGWRWYILASYSVGDLVKLSIKYAELRKSGVKLLGSGYDAIEGGLDNSMHVQLDIAF